MPNKEYELQRREKAVQNLEEAFGEFIDHSEYDEAENALFSIIRTAFKAGWSAAMSEASEPQMIDFVPSFKVIPKKNKIS